MWCGWNKVVSLCAAVAGARWVRGAVPRALRPVPPHAPPSHTMWHTTIVLPRFFSITQFQTQASFCVVRHYQIISKIPAKRNKAILEPRFTSDTSIRSVFCSLVRFSESKNQFCLCIVTEMWTLFMCCILVKVSHFIINLIKTT